MGDAPTQPPILLQSHFSSILIIIIRNKSYLLLALNNHSAIFFQGANMLYWFRFRCVSTDFQSPIIVLRGLLLIRDRIFMYLHIFFLDSPSSETHKNRTPRPGGGLEQKLIAHIYMFLFFSTYFMYLYIFWPFLKKIQKN